MDQLNTLELHLFVLDLRVVRHHQPAHQIPQDSEQKRPQVKYNRFQHRGTVLYSDTAAPPEPLWRHPHLPSNAFTKLQAIAIKVLQLYHSLASAKHVDRG